MVESAARLPATNENTAEGAFHSRFDYTGYRGRVGLDRDPLFRRSYGRPSPVRTHGPVAHPGPGRSRAPRIQDVQYLIQRMEEEIERNEGLLTEEALDEYRQALKVYRSIAERAVN